MGLASSIGLGLALARPDVRVFVLDGDGSLLMNLGSLATIGCCGRPNLVLDRDGQRGVRDDRRPATPTAHGADLDAAARAMGVDGDRDGADRRACVRCDSSASRAAPGPWVDRRQGRRIGADREAAARLRLHQAAIHGGDRQSGAGDVIGQPLAVAAIAARDFVGDATPPPRRAPRAARRVLDTVGVTLAGASEPASAHRPASRSTARTAAAPCGVLGTAVRASAGDAALANGTAAHALDYDDMCFVSLAHPSAPLVPAALAAGGTGGASGAARSSTPTSSASRSKARLGRADEPAALPARLALHVDARHDRRGGGGVAAARARRGRRRTRARDRRVGSVGPEGELRDDGEAAACGAGGAQRRARGAAGAGRDDGERARRIDGPQGFLRAMDSEQPTLDERRRRSRRALGDSRHRHHGQAVSVVRRHASDARRAARSARGAKDSPRRRRARSRSASIRSCRRS